MVGGLDSLSKPDIQREEAVLPTRDGAECGAFDVALDGCVLNTTFLHRRSLKLLPFMVWSPSVLCLSKRWEISTSYS